MLVTLKMMISAMFGFFFSNIFCLIPSSFLGKSREVPRANQHRVWHVLFVFVLHNIETHLQRGNVFISIERGCSLFE